MAAWNEHLSVFFAFLGMISVGLAFWPGFYKTWKTKDTKFLPIKLFSLFLLAGALMTAGSIAGVCTDVQLSNMYVRGWFFVLLNAFVLFTNLYTVCLWCKNKVKERVRGYDSLEDYIPEEEESFDEESLDSPSPLDPEELEEAV